MSCLDFFPQLGHPVLGQRWIDLPEVKVRVIPVTPAHETADFAAVTVTGLLAAGAAALGQEPLDQQVRRNGVKVRLWTHYRAASAASPSTGGHEAPQSAAAAKGPGDLSHASPSFRERSEVQKTGGHQQSLPCCAEKGEAPRQQPKPPVGSGFDVDSDNSKPETIPPLNLDCPF